MAPGRISLQDRIAGLLPSWRIWLRSKHRQLRAHHDDIVQESAADLLAWSRDRAQTMDEDSLRRVGFRILQRRAADVVRMSVKHWADEEPSVDLVDPSGNVDPTRVLEVKQRMRLLMAVLADFNAEERAMLMGAEIGLASNDDAPMSAATRKRLERLRERVTKALNARGWRGATPWPPSDEDDTREQK